MFNEKQVSEWLSNCGLRVREANGYNLFPVVEDDIYTGNFVAFILKKGDGVVLDFVLEFAGSGGPLSKERFDEMIAMSRKAFLGVAA